MPGAAFGHYGDELTLRLSAVTRTDALHCDETIAGFLRQLVTDIGMTVIGGPVVATQDGPAEKAGKSAIVILAESHAAIHTYPALREVFFNLFSCKPFSESVVLSALSSLVGGFEVTERALVRRGEHWHAA